jgi:serine/threonine protein kinase
MLAGILLWFGPRGGDRGAGEGMVLQRYRAKAELGKGSFGTVYLTEGRRDKKTYVVKVSAHELIFETNVLQAHRQQFFHYPCWKKSSSTAFTQAHAGTSCFAFVEGEMLVCSLACVQVVDNLRENNLKVQEIRVMMHLKHRNIVEMCDFYTSNNQV